MVDVIYNVAVSLDGFVARRDLDFDWLGPFIASGDDYVGEFIDSTGALLVGSHTYAESEQSREWFGQVHAAVSPSTCSRPVSCPSLAQTRSSGRMGSCGCAMR